MLKTKPLASILYWICCATLLALPILVLAFLVFDWPTAARASEIYEDINIISPPPSWAFWLANLYSLLSLCAVMVMLFFMAQLFQQYRDGLALSFQSADRLRSVGYSLWAIAIFKFFSHPIHTMLLTSGNPEGKRELAVAFTDSELGFFLAAGLITLVGKAMAEAAQNAEDIKGFV
ncbi:MAG: DUF2975 domain-containing protein [Pseudomonadota bacterium]|nr:DUF2975 domain-containing protein [Pseudomonadota bacterium]